MIERNLEIDTAIILAVNKYDMDNVDKKENDTEDYILIDDPINRIKDFKY